MTAQLDQVLCKLNKKQTNYLTRSVCISICTKNMTTNTKLVINSAKLVKKLTHSTFFAPGTEKTKSLKKLKFSHR